MAVKRLLRLCLLILTTLSPSFRLSISITDSESLLEFKQSLSNSKSLDSWVQNSEPCGQNSRWIGVICRKNVVYGLQLERMGLSGNIGILSLTKLSGLRTISIMNNSFSGTIPEFNQLTGLKSLYLSGNKFSGVIRPDYFSKMASLKKVWLSNNEFQGPIPSSLATNLPSLLELRLENNKFRGIIPNFSQSTLNLIDFSNNKLEGEIPSGLQRFNAGVFAGNPGLCGPKMENICTKSKDSGIKTDGPMRNASKSKYIIAAVTLAALFLLVLVFFIYQKRKQKKNKLVSSDDQNEVVQQESQIVQVTVASGPAKRGAERLRSSKKTGRKGAAELIIVNDAKGVFGLPDLMKASAEILVEGTGGGGGGGGGSGGKVGSTYKAVMANGVAVVVKRVMVMSQVSKESFDEEIKRLGSLRHKNLLTPLAFHFRRDEKLLVYEFVPNRSLLFRLHVEDQRLDWPTRLKVIEGIARGMVFLHSELGFLSLPHGNLKSSNVLLADDGEPLLSDFGLQRLINPDAQFQSLVAYKSPEAKRNGIVSAKSDVFSIGVVILEIMTGKFPSQYAGAERSGGTDMVEWVRSAVENGGWMELIDPTVAAAAAENSSGEIIEKILQIGVACTSDDPDRRPDVNEVADSVTNVQLNDNFSYANKSVDVNHHHHHQQSSPPSENAFDGGDLRFAVP